jgi:hypothetical protein
MVQDRFLRVKALTSTGPFGEPVQALLDCDRQPQREHGCLRIDRCRIKRRKWLIYP